MCLAVKSVLGHILAKGLLEITTFRITKYFSWKTTYTMGIEERSYFAMTSRNLFFLGRHSLFVPVNVKYNYVDDFRGGEYF